MSHVVVAVSSLLALLVTLGGMSDVRAVDGMLRFRFQQLRGALELNSGPYSGLPFEYLLFLKLFFFVLKFSME